MSTAPAFHQSQLPGFYVDVIFRNKRVVHFRALQLGAIMFLARAYWDGGARPLPSDDTTLMLLAGLHGRQWSEQRERLLTAWREIEPQLAAVYAREERKAANIRAVALKGSQAALLAAAQKGRQSGRKFAESSNSKAAPLVPKIENPISLGRTTDGERIPARTTRGNAKRFSDTMNTTTTIDATE